MNQRDLFYIYDNPVPYKDLLLYPILMKDFYMFQIFSSCLMLEKNSTREIKYITMSYLQYLYETDNPANNNKMFFDALLRMVLRNPDMEAVYGFDENKKPYFLIDKTYYYSNDFNEIKNIITEQNEIELPDETIQKEVRDRMEEARRYKQKLSGNKIASLEEQIVALGIYTGWTLDYINNMTVRKFIKAIKRSDHILTSKIYLQASLSGMVEFKDKSIIKHWLADLNTDKNRDIIVDIESVENKINFNEAKEK